MARKRRAFWSSRTFAVCILILTCWRTGCDGTNCHYGTSPPMLTKSCDTLDLYCGTCRLKFSTAPKNHLCLLQLRRLPEALPNHLPDQVRPNKSNIGLCMVSGLKAFLHLRIRSWQPGWKIRAMLTG